MSDMPPDSARLRAILAHLDRQLADTDTIRTYLRLQREEVQRANRPAGHNRTFGYARAEILAALANCLLLLGV
ncbi:hypothetical protein ABT275_45895, partial [Streptomyces sp. NPDC001185]